jgi:RecB family exonuclease
VDVHVGSAFATKLPARAREGMPRRYIEMEARRLTTLVGEWLRYERTRMPFSVAATEVDAETMVAGLALKVRLDRVDQLNDGELLVIDYKSGDVSPKSWELPRPEDVQLPLYAGFAVHGAMGKVGGLVFAKVRAGDVEFAGRVRNAKATLLSSLRGNTNLVKQPLSAEQFSHWKTCIEQLAIDFLAGNAATDPRDYPKTCDRCELQVLCRVQEIKGSIDGDGEEAASE